MAYLYDVFISYKRGKIQEQWLDEIFLPHFTDHLDNALENPPRIFVDRKGLTPGVDFSDELFEKLVRSKSLVSIWSPPYFRRSEWCVKEYLSMRKRQEKLNLNATTRPQTLVWPVMYREVDPLPDAIVGRATYLNYCKYNLVGEAFFKSPLFLEFQADLGRDIASLAEIIENAPPLEPVFENEENKKKYLQEIRDYWNSKTNDTPPPPHNPI